MYCKDCYSSLKQIVAENLRPGRRSLRGELEAVYQPSDAGAGCMLGPSGVSLSAKGFHHRTFQVLPAFLSYRNVCGLFPRMTSSIGAPAAAEILRPC